MTNEEKILALLEGMDKRLEKLEDEQSKTSTNTAALKAMLNTLKLDVDDLKVGQAKIQKDIDEIKTDVKYIWGEIDRHTDRISGHDTILKEIL